MEHIESKLFIDELYSDLRVSKIDFFCSGVGFGNISGKKLA